MTGGRLSITPTLREAPVPEPRDQLRGDSVAPGDLAREKARSVQNGLIDGHSAVIARCAETGDVAAAVDFARCERLAGAGEAAR